MKCRRSATFFAVVLLPEAAGPSIAMIMINQPFEKAK